jgi:hypothetical protein
MQLCRPQPQGYLVETYICAADPLLRPQATHQLRTKHQRLRYESERAAERVQKLWLKTGHAYAGALH